MQVKIAKMGDVSLSWLRVARVAAIACAAALVCGYLDHYTQMFDLLEQKTYGERLEVAAQANTSQAGITQAESIQHQIVLIMLTDADFQAAMQGQPPSRYLPRAAHARLIRELTRDGAKVIAFDFLFDFPQPDDPVLADAVRRSGRVLLACGDTGGEPLETLPPDMRLVSAGPRLGHTRVPMDLDRPAIDRVAAVVTSRGQSVPAFSVEAARMALGLTGQPLRQTKTGWQIGAARAGLTIPTDDDGTFKIRYRGPPSRPGKSSTFAAFPYAQIVNATAAESKIYRDKQWFTNKIVLIGDTRLMNGDTHLTPLGMMAGVEIQANAVATLLQGQSEQAHSESGGFLRAAPWSGEIAQLFALAFLAALFAGAWPLNRAALFLGLLLPAYFVLNVAAFVQDDFYLHLVAPMMTLILTALGVLLERGLIEEREKTRMRGLLQRYVSPKIAEHILQHPTLLRREGKRVTGTVLFSDIRGFTALSEQLPPEELVRRMNEYFQAMTDIIFCHEGTTASFVGDALLALFGVPVPSPDHARRAVAAAIEMQSALKALQDTWRAQGQQVFDIGIGINTGEMVVGDVGGRHLMNFTVYGLQVNIASRVEMLNKELGTGILITRATYEAVANEVEARGPLPSPVKGVEDALDVYEVIGWRSGFAP